MSEEISAIFLIAEVSEFQSARFYNVYEGARISAARKLLKLSHDLRTPSEECSKLGKTRIIMNASLRLVRNTGFCGQNLLPYGYLELSGIYF